MILLTEDDARPERNDWPRKNGRALIPHPDTGDTVHCYSPSNLTSYLGGGFSNPTWEARCQAKGAGLRPDLAIMAAPLDIKADKDELDRIVAELEQAGGRNAAANRGTAMHSAIRRILRGLDPELPDDCNADIAAIRQAIDEWGLELVEGWDERHLFNPHLPSFGQCDGFVRVRALDGVLGYDAKTGQFKPLDCAVQISAYANSTHSAELVDGLPVLEALPFEIRTDIGLVLHAPWGQGRADIIAVDLVEGYRLAQLAVSVHQETLNSGRFRIKDVGSLVGSPTQVEPTGGAANGYRADTSASDAAPPPSLHARIGGLRQRLKRLTEQGAITIAEVKTLMDEALEAVPLTKPDDQTTASLDWWQALVELHEMSLDPGDRVADIRARLEALPVDLLAHATTRAKDLEPPVPNLDTGTATAQDLDRLEQVLAPIEVLHAERIAQVTQHLSGVTEEQASALIAWACEQRDEMFAETVPVSKLDNLEAARVIALCHTYAHDDLPAALKSVGAARDVLATARRLAAAHDLPMPKSGKAVASDRVLAGLVLSQSTTPERDNA